MTAAFSTPPPPTRLRDRLLSAVRGARDRSAPEPLALAQQIRAAPYNPCRMRLLKGVRPAPAGPDRQLEPPPAAAPAAPEIDRAAARPLLRPAHAIPILWLIAVYAALNYGLIGLTLPAGVSFYGVQPALWLSVGLVAWLAGRALRVPAAPRDSSVVVAGLLMGGVSVAILLLLGLAFGFGQSPYSHGLLPMLGNLLYGLSGVVSSELLRGYLTAVLGRGRAIRALAIPTVLLAAVSLPAAQYAALAGLQSGVQFSGERLLPALSEGLLASFLALSGGPAASLAYRGLIEVFEWASPILPSTDWIITAFAGTLVPVLGLVTIQDLFAPEAQPQAAGQPAPERESVAGILSWVLVGIVGVGLIWFNTGAFGYTPTLLSGPSMNPTLWAGDIVIVKEVPVEEIAVGDIIKFWQEGRYVIHRVIRIEQTEAGVVITTQGDNVNAPDFPVTEEYIKGKVVLVLPKVGYVSIAARWVIEWIGAGAARLRG